MSRKNWDSEKIFSRLLSNKTKKTYWENIHELRSRPTQEVFDRANSLAQSKIIDEKLVGIHVLAQLGFPRFNQKKTLDTYFEILKTENNPKVIAAVLSSIGHNNQSLTQDQISFLCTNKNHSYSDVRFGLVQSLGGIENPSAIETLVELSKDKHSVVREWATFNLGSQITSTDKIVSDALWDRISDQDFNTRREAIAGLAQRKDPRIKGILIDELQKIDEHGSVILESIQEFGDKTFIPLLEKQIHENRQSKNINEQWLVNCVSVLKSMNEIA